VRRGQWPADPASSGCCRTPPSPRAVATPTGLARGRPARGEYVSCAACRARTRGVSSAASDSMLYVRSRVHVNTTVQSMFESGGQIFERGGNRSASMCGMSTTRSTILVVIVCLANFGLARHVSGQGRGRGAALTLPDGPGKEAVQSQCTKCHALGLIANSGGFTKQGWTELIGTMVSLPAAQQSEIS